MAEVLRRPNLRPNLRRFPALSKGRTWSYLDAKVTMQWLRVEKKGVGRARRAAGRGAGERAARARFLTRDGRRAWGRVHPSRPSTHLRSLDRPSNPRPLSFLTPQTPLSLLSFPAPTGPLHPGCRPRRDRRRDRAGRHLPPTPGRVRRHRGAVLHTRVHGVYHAHAPAAGVAPPALRLPFHPDRAHHF